MANTIVDPPAGEPMPAAAQPSASASIEAPAPAQAAQPPSAAPPAPPAPPEPAQDPDLFSKMLNNPLFLAEVEKRAALAAKKAREEAEAAAAEAARRAKMEEADRLRAEKQDQERLAQEAQQKASEAAREAALYKAILDNKLSLQDGGERYLKWSIDGALRADPSLTVDAALKKVIQEHPFLVQAPPAAPPQAASTSPVQRHSQDIAVEQPKTPVDTLKMTRAEYQQYVRDRHLYSR